uniref:MADF domain-containing protein n=1 Tax=Caenorhabditis tropicalis TaxID=1561998 RepID=A0A1I7UCP3_9PELO
MLDPNRLEEFIEQVRLTPAIWKNREYSISRDHLNEIWAHFGHTFDISSREAERQWEYLIRLHKYMNKNAKQEEFRIPTKIEDDRWNDADNAIADSLSLFLKPFLDELLLISKPSETSV